MQDDAGAEFIRAMHAKTRRGSVSAGTDSHLTREFRSQGTRQAREPFPAAIDREIGRLRLEADTPQRLKDVMLGTQAPPAPPRSVGPKDEDGAGPEAPGDGA